MIVLSGALVLVALVLLVFGALDRNLPYVYGSIGVSLAALLLLFLSILQRRGQVDDGEQAGAVEAADPGEPERVPAMAGAGQPAAEAQTDAAAEPPARVSRLVRRPQEPGRDEPSAPEAHTAADTSLEHDEHDEAAYDDEHDAAYDDEPDGEAAYDDEAAYEEDADLDEEDEDAPAAAHDQSGHDPEQDAEEGVRLVPSPLDGEQEPAPAREVLVVSGRPRYHVAGCRYLTGKSPERVELDDAQAHGFTPCGVCKPDAVLADQPQDEQGWDEQPERGERGASVEEEQPQGELAEGESAEAELADGELAEDDHDEDDHDEHGALADELFDDEPSEDQLPEGELAEDERSEDEEAEDGRPDAEHSAASGSAVPAAGVTAPDDADAEPSLEHVLFGEQVLGGPPAEASEVPPATGRPSSEDASLSPELSEPGRVRAGAVPTSAAESGGAPEPSRPEPTAAEPPARRTGSGAPSTPDPATVELRVPSGLEQGQQRTAGDPEQDAAPELAAAPAQDAGETPATPAPVPTDAGTVPSRADDGPAEAAATSAKRARTPAKAAKRAPAPVEDDAAATQAGQAPARKGKAPTKATTSPAKAPVKAPARAAKTPAQGRGSRRAEPVRGRTAVPEEPPTTPVRTTPVRAVRADALRLTSPTGATTTRKVAVRAAAIGARPTTPPATAATPAVPVRKAAGGTASGASRVVVIPDRARFHRADCRHVRDAEGATTLTKAAAAKQGYVPCGVCQP